MLSENLSHVLYASAAAPGFVHDDLTSILERSRENNERRAISGLLLYTEGSFFQLLEGERATLAEVLEIIKADPRHMNVTTIIDEPIAQRDFADWKMGFSEMSREEITKADGLSDFFQDGESFLDLRPGRAKKLLAAFRDGRWRLQGK